MAMAPARRKWVDGVTLLTIRPRCGLRIGAQAQDSIRIAIPWSGYVSRLCFAPVVSCVGGRRAAGPRRSGWEVYPHRPGTVLRSRPTAEGPPGNGPRRGQDG